MMNEATEDILDHIKLMIASGFCDLEEINESIEEMLYDDADEAFLKGFVVPAYQKKKAEEKNWPKITDCDRLETAFENLNENEIIAIHVAGYTTSDGVDEAYELREEMGSENVIGFCFYHEQDMDGAVRHNQLYIGYGSFSSEEQRNINIAEKVVQELERQGLTVTWNGNPKERLLLPFFDWKRRGP